MTELLTCLGIGLIAGAIGLHYGGLAGWAALIVLFLLYGHELSKKREARQREQEDAKIEAEIAEEARLEDIVRRRVDEELPERRRMEGPFHGSR